MTTVNNTTATCVSVTSAMASWLPAVNEVLQIIAAIIAITAGTIALVGWWRARKGSAHGQRPVAADPSVSPRSAAAPADSTGKK